MASLLKPWVVRYLDAEGRQVPKGAPGARKVKERAAKWYGQYVDIDDKRRRVPLCTDKAAARQMLARLEREVQLGRAGVSDPYADHRKAPVAEHVAGYEVSLRNKGVSAKGLSEALRRLRAVLEGCGARALGDLRPESVERFLDALAAKGAGASTRNTYLKTAKAFMNWSVQTRRAADNPLACLRAAPADLRRRRRALTEAELARLLAATQERPLVKAMTVKRGPNRGQVTASLRPETRAAIERLGLEHALIYKTLVLTGLRRGELEALEVRHLTLDGPRPFLALPPSATKNRCGADLPLRADLAADLARWVAATGKRGGDRVFRVARGLNALLKRDMAWAGIPYKDDQGRTVDVHALRHTTATHLGKGKVAPRVAQGFMRHSDIKLTMQTYTDPRLLDEAEALDALPDLPLDGGHGTGGAKGKGGSPRAG
jgi:integrase